ncbi:zf-HC2 domain-containing protein [Halobacillus sp. A5]|uniref:zf-HC2 domain-containing protein n=1 Tax=Halobacillus sp. A5 TaxID=2880263 RepID=UPI0020A652F8|nr:zf-HC2 domain-containing protein [Halobacillus sp. A5]MCP3029445.1 zf-HC2 domain-containing protein [Halobacillus sp. A5]
MNCKQEAVILMHKHLDGELEREEERRLRDHLQACTSCQKHFHELKRSTALIKDTGPIAAPSNFTADVMAALPKEKKRRNYIRKLQRHPIITAAAIFFLLMFSGIFSAWNQDQQVSVSKQENLIIENNTVIVPENITVDGDLVVRNGDLKVEGKIDGDITLINGDFITDDPENELANGENYQAYASGEVNEVNQVFEWMWYHTKKFVTEIFSFAAE